MKKILVNKKSQTEIMGLAIVVILIAFGIVFMMKYMATKKPVEYQKEYSQAELASNIINALLKTTTEDCLELSFADLYKDCGENPNGGSIDCSGGTTPDSCSYSRTQTEIVLINTLGAWGMNYEFIAYLDEADPLDFSIWGSGISIKSISGCPGEKKSKRYSIPAPNTPDQTVYIKLDICD